MSRVDINGYTWKAPGKPVPQGTANTVVCRKGKPAPRVIFSLRPEHTALYSACERGGYYCAQGCVFEHEEEHIKDIVAQNPNICQGVQDETIIENDNPSELLQSELKAWQVEQKCLEGCQQKYPRSRTVADRLGKVKAGVELIKKYLPDAATILSY